MVAERVLEWDRAVEQTRAPRRPPGRPHDHGDTLVSGSNTVILLPVGAAAARGGTENITARLAEGFRISVARVDQLGGALKDEKTRPPVGVGNEHGAAGIAQQIAELHVGVAQALSACVPWPQQAAINCAMVLRLTKQKWTSYHGTRVAGRPVSQSKDRANVLSGARALDTATTRRSKTSKIKRLEH